jgi:hypothetical protein
MKTLIALAVLGLMCSAASADDGGNLPPSPPQDALTISWGYSCNPYPGCEFGADWTITDPSGADDLIGWGYAMDPSYVPDPIQGALFTVGTTIVESFSPDAACDATTNEFVCDQMILGLWTNGAPIPLNTLPFYAQEQAEQALFPAAATVDPAPDPSNDPVGLPEPSEVLMLGAGLLGLAAIRKLA